MYFSLCGTSNQMLFFSNQGKVIKSFSFQSYYHNLHTIREDLMRGKNGLFNQEENNYKTIFSLSRLELFPVGDTDHLNKTQTTLIIILSFPLFPRNMAGFHIIISPCFLSLYPPLPLSLSFSLSFPMHSRPGDPRRPPLL